MDKCSHDITDALTRGIPRDIPRASLAVADLDIGLRLPRAGLEVEFLGPTLRGLLGYGLRQVACGHASGPDGHCACPARCDYAYLFEGAHPAPPRALLGRAATLPQPFRLVLPELRAARDPHAVRFTVRLFGSRAISLAPRVIDAIDARRQHGIGAREARFELDTATVGPTRHLWFGTGNTPPDDLEVRFVTPTMLTRSIGNRRGPGASAAPAIAAADLMAAGRARAWLLAHAYGRDAACLPDPRGPMGISGAPTIMAEDNMALSRWRIRRRSGRQQRAVDLAGVVGQCRLHADWSTERWWLGVAGELGVGRHTSFGLGQIHLPQVTRLEVASVRASQPDAGPRAARARQPRWVQLRGLPPTRARTTEPQSIL
jgi:hypothetical protein